MSLIRIASHEPGSQGWLEQRRTALGGSEIAAVLGLSPWESRFSLHLRKLDLTPPIEDTGSMEWGRRLEKPILDKWHEESGALEVRRRETWLRDGWRLANPDGVAVYAAGPDVVVEIKTARSADEWGEVGTDDIPVYYRTQVLWYLGVLDLQQAEVAVLIMGSDYRTYHIERDDEDLALLVGEGRSFLDDIAAGIRPDIDSSYATYRAIRESHPRIEQGAEVEATDELAELLLSTSRDEKAAKTAHRHAQSQALDLMGNAQHLIHDGRRIAYRMARRDRDGLYGNPYLALDRKATK